MLVSYHAIFTYYLGQTPGKMLLGIQVVDTTVKDRHLGKSSSERLLARLSSFSHVHRLYLDNMGSE
ncbi:MAG: hypothetical protein Ct9H300mP11_28540 [Chloroflexota bacterium]|nr:MAG: hypothetical protein Ct9H300mP11_28540 [Chloroflexota bacterium]